jgi:hypothetical protein
MIPWFIIQKIELYHVRTPSTALLRNAMFWRYLFAENECMSYNETITDIYLWIA